MGHSPKTGFYIASKGKRVDFKATTSLFLSGYGIVDITLPKEGVEWLYCRNNHLTELNLPEGLNGLWCRKNKLNSLKLPKSLNVISCDFMDGIEEQDRKERQIEFFQSNFVFPRTNTL